MEAGKDEQRGAVSFLTAEGIDNHAKMLAVYGESNMSRAHMFESNKRFREMSVVTKRQYSAMTGSSCHYNFYHCHQE